MIYHVLIVDDESAIKKGLSMLIQKAIPNCVIDGTASDGAEAIEMVKNSPPDIVITDIKMPVCNGLELSKFLFENYPDIKIIMLTGFADFEYAQNAIKYRVSDYLLKPTSKSKLVEAITKTQSEIAELRKTRCFLRKNSALFLERALQEAASGTFAEEYMQSIMECWPDDNPSYYCISFQCKNNDPNEKNHITLVRNILEQQLQNCFIFRYNNAINCLYFNIPTEVNIGNKVFSFAQEIVNLSSQLYGVTLSAGISQPKQTVSLIATASVEAHSALLSNFFSGQIIGLFTPDSFPSERYTETTYRASLFALEKALDEQKYSSASEMIQNLFTSFSQNCISSSQVKYISGQIYYVLTRSLLHKGLPEVQLDFLTLLEHSTNAEALQNALLHMVAQIQQSIAQNGKQKSHTVRNTIEYILLHLLDDLALETIAEAVNVNPSYLSRIFKKECGETLTEYITRMRIDKAKELLCLPDNFVYQVSEETGFNDPAYFSTIFKKYTGMSPKEYRQKYSN